MGHDNVQPPSNPVNAPPNRNSGETGQSLRCKNGGNVWESNPPSVGLARNNGFEAREGHQFPVHSLFTHINLTDMVGNDLANLAGLNALSLQGINESTGIVGR